MQLSLAQDASYAFSRFTDDPFENPDFLKFGSSDRRSLGKLQYLSDWLELWLLCGAAARACGGNFTIYLQSVIVSIADMQYDPMLYPRVENFLPSNGDVPDEDDDRKGLNDSSYELPNPLSSEYFVFIKNIDDEERSALVRAFLAHSVSQ
jgi:hypothetical protein